MKSSHQIFFENANNLDFIQSQSIDLVVTSPPYPLVEIWDSLFSESNPKIKHALETNDGFTAFELMHQELDKVWCEINKVLKEGGIICINVGDTTRKIGENFCLYPSHSRILQTFSKLGFYSLPGIIWRKQTNAPTKFMGSGMLPPSAYITLEHEHILILRKGKKREFKPEQESKVRRESAYFWEERNIWFSDMWDLRGIPQALGNDNLRERSAAFPFELANRLINMFSIKGDVVLDPFIGTGTTMFAAMTSARNSIGLEIDERFYDLILSGINDIVEFANEHNSNRIQKHIDFIKENSKKYEEAEYINKFYNLPVTTKQEIDLKLNVLEDVKEVTKGHFQVEYED